MKENTKRWSEIRLALRLSLASIGVVSMSVFSGGCQVELPEVITCENGGACPEGLTCRAEVCVNAADGGAADGAAVDGAAVDGAAADAGTVRSLATFRGLGAQGVSALEIGDDTIYIAGPNDGTLEYDTEGSVTAVPFASPGAYIARIDGSSPVWVTAIVPESDASTVSIAGLAWTGGGASPFLAVGGSFTGDWLGTTNHDGSDILLMRADDSGLLSDFRIFGAVGEDSVTALAPTRLGFCAVGSVSGMITDLPSPSRGGFQLCDSERAIFWHDFPVRDITYDQGDDIGYLAWATSAGAAAQSIGTGDALFIATDSAGGHGILVAIHDGNPVLVWSHSEAQDLNIDQRPGIADSTRSSLHVAGAELVHLEAHGMAVHNGVIHLVGEFVGTLQAGAEGPMITSDRRRGFHWTRRVGGGDPTLSKFETTGESSLNAIGFMDGALVLAGSFAGDATYPFIGSTSDVDNTDAFVVVLNP